MMTYLSQFPKAQLKPGAPLRPKKNPKKVRAYGKGEETLLWCSSVAPKLFLQAYPFCFLEIMADSQRIVKQGKLK